MSYDKKIFKDKTLGDLFEDIYNNSKDSKTKANEVIDELMNKMETLKDSLMVVPIIKDYLELGVKNDDLLVKIANIIQRMESAQSKNADIEGDLLDDPEVKKLMEEAEKAKKGNT